MAKKAQVKLDRRGVGDFLRGPEVRQMVRASGNRIAQRAGNGFEADTWVSPEPGRSGEPRAVSGVSAESSWAKRKQSRDNVIQRSVDAGRL